MSKLLVVSSNMYNEIDQLPSWFTCMEGIADAGIVIVDSGSTDGSIEFAKDRGAIVIVDDIIRREGYGPARNHLREMAKKHFPFAHWNLYLDADERISTHEFHRLRFLKDNLRETFDVVALARIDWLDLAMTHVAKDVEVYPDWQARMTRLDSPIKYVRMLHEQITGYKGIYTNIRMPKINHFHRSAGQAKRDLVGKLCAKLHMEDKEFGETYPMHHKEAEYRERYIKEGL